jgi:hypothetical protein
MKSFLTHSNEVELLKSDLIVEAAGEEADTKGKVRELEVGQHLNGGVHMTSYRAEGKTPGEIHHAASISKHGADYKKNAVYKARQKVSQDAAKHIRAHLQKHGHGTVTRTVWASQPSDHESETGTHDSNNSADLILTTSKTHKRLNEAVVKSGKERNENKVAISVKTGHSKVNYSNPGVAGMAGITGASHADLQKHVAKHEKTVKANLPSDKGNSHEKYKELRDSGNKEKQAKAAEIKHSSEQLNKSVSHTMRHALHKKTEHELHRTITDAVSPKTHLKHIVSRQITYAPTHKTKAGEEKSHQTYDLHKHVHEYLDHFHSLHVDPHSTSTAVTIHGIHKKTGKKMPVANVTVSAGGRPANHSPRGTVNLSSEDHKDVHYSDKSEHMVHTDNGK